MKKPQDQLLPLLIASLLLCAAVYFSDLFGRYRLIAVACLAALVLLLYFLLYSTLKRQYEDQLLMMDMVFNENTAAAAKIINDVNVPCVLIDGDGKVVWRNAVFEKLFDEDDIKTIMPGFTPRLPQGVTQIEYGGGAYQVMNMPVHRNGVERPLTFQYWLDRTEAAHYKRLFEEQMPYVALVYADNYEELASDVQFHRTTVLAEIERLVSETARNVGGVYRRYESGRFFMIFEAHQLELMEQQRFPLLEAAHNIETGTNAQVSLSIAVGMADRIFQSDESARQAMELALGRGGDQAVVKAGTAYRFYGGKRQMESMQSRVKTRLFSKALRQLFENAGDVFIMGHKRSDMDCMGAALGIATCAKKLGSRAYILQDAFGAGIDRALEMIESNRAYASMLVTPEQAEKMVRPSSILVVVDTQRPSNVIASQLLPLFSRVVVIDHHRRSTDYIENPTLHYLESRASSASELVTEILQYFDDDMRPPAFVCGVLLAGITVDTKHFAFNVGSRTFEAAGYLRKNGADIAMVKQLFQDDMQSFEDCADTVRSADIMPGGVAVATVAEGVPNAKLIAAKAADELVGIRGIEAAFVLGREDGTVSVSGRSVGNVNVQLICEKMGGGGHLTMAGAQLGDIDLEEGCAVVRSAVESFRITGK